MSDGFSHIDQERTRSGGKTGIPAPGGVANHALAVWSERSQHQEPPTTRRILGFSL